MLWTCLITQEWRKYPRCRECIGITTWLDSRKNALTVPTESLLDDRRCQGRLTHIRDCRGVPWDNRVPWRRAQGYFLLLLPPCSQMNDVAGRSSTASHLLRVNDIQHVMVQKKVFLPIVYNPKSPGTMMSWDSRDNPAPFLWTEYVMTILGRTSTGKRVYLSASFQLRDRDWFKTASVIQRYAVETVVGLSFPTCQPGGHFRMALEVKRQNNWPKATLCDRVHQMKMLRCCRADFLDRTWVGSYIAMKNRVK